MQYKGQLKGFPKEIVDKMLDYQFIQTGKRDISVFEDYKHVSFDSGGFNWDRTIEGYTFWNNIINNCNFDDFFKLYPKNPYPKLMWVGDALEEVKRRKIKRVVFAKKRDSYMAWSIAESLEDAENEIGCTTWKFAEDVVEEPATIELSLKEIAEKFNIPVENLKIVEK